jgi:transcriptional regulator with XRE-family HTH domain
MTKYQVIQLLKQNQGTQTQEKYAEKLDITPAYLSDLYMGRRSPGKKILDKLGLRKEISYKRKEGHA